MRTILHSDLNNFYASVELMRHPEWRGKPVVVVGAKEERHGVVLAKNDIAKGLGVKTGDVYWEAERKCGKQLVQTTADFPAYLRASKEVRKIYAEYTDRIEAFGIDECWLDVTQSVNLFGGGRKIADLIRERVKRETGLTVSVGVSFNKIFAKLGSDMKKPDAVTEITPDNFRETVWKLPVENLLYVGAATKKKLNKLGIKTIGQLAGASERTLVFHLGKWGSYLLRYARGEDEEPVTDADEDEVKSVGNSVTLYRDVTEEADVESVIFMLADSVCARMRDGALKRAGTVKLWVRSSDLTSYMKQAKIRPTGNATELGRQAMKLFRESYTWTQPVRALGVTASDFVSDVEQLDLFGGYELEEKRRRLDLAIDDIRFKYGSSAVQPAVVLRDKKLTGMDIQGEHSLHPRSFKNQAEKGEKGGGKNSSEERK